MTVRRCDVLVFLGTTGALDHKICLGLLSLIKGGHREGPVIGRANEDGNLEQL